MVPLAILAIVIPSLFAVFAAARTPETANQPIAIGNTASVSQPPVPVPTTTPIQTTEPGPSAPPTSDPAPAPEPTTTTNTQTAPTPAEDANKLVVKTDLSYQGSFRVPYSDGTDETSLSWGGVGLGYNPSNDSLFITGHSWHQLTAEIDIPALGQETDSSALPQASFIQTPEDATDGKLPSVSTPEESVFGRIGGYLVDGDDLIVSGYDFYDAANNQTRSHLVTNTSLGDSSDFVTLTNDVPARWLGGAMTTIPLEWRDSFGGDTFMGGLSGVSIASNSSVGPSAATFTRDSLDGSHAAKLVLGYPLSRPLAPYDAHNDVWNGTSEVRGMVFPDGTDSVLYFGNHGVGEFCYGTGAECGDPVRSDQGTHGYPYRYQVWAYDAADLATVYAGDAAPESIFPYDVWDLELPYTPLTTEISGTAYDPATVTRIATRSGRTTQPTWPRCTPVTQLPNRSSRTTYGI